MYSLSAAAPPSRDFGEALGDLHRGWIDLCRLDLRHLHRPRVRRGPLGVLADHAGRLKLHDRAVEQLLVEAEHPVPLAAQGIGDQSARTSDTGEPVLEV